MPPDLFIVIPVHNRREFTRACLEHLSLQTHHDFRVVVVDDGSTDGTCQMVRRDFPDVLLLSGDGSLWWSGATNRGISRALELGATHILCLNDDTSPAPDLIERLLETAHALPNTLIGAHTIDARTRAPYFAGERMNWLTASPQSLLTRPSAERITDVSHAPGRGLFIPALVLRQIGLFDQRHFPQYAADYDFTHRARRAGFRVVCDRLAVLGIFPEESGDAQTRAHKSWANYRTHLFGIKGGGNLRVFFWYALRNCPRPLLPFCLAAGLLRRICGYPLEWVMESWRAPHAGHRA